MHTDMIRLTIVRECGRWPPQYEAELYYDLQLW